MPKAQPAPASGRDNRRSRATQNDDEAGPSHRGTQAPPPSQQQRQQQQPTGQRQQQQQQPQASQQQQPQPTVHSDYHRFAFVQRLMTQGCMKETEAKDLVRRLVGSNADGVYDKIIQAINKGVKEVAGFEVRAIKYLVDQQRYVGLVNLKSDTPSKLGTTYTAPQLNYFKHALAAIAAVDVVEDERPGVPCMSETELLNLDMSDPAAGAGGTQAAAAAPKKLSKQEITPLLHRLLFDKWLASVPDKAGWWTIGVRSYLELGGYLMELENLPEATKNVWDKAL